VELVGLEPTTSSLRTMRSPKKPQCGVHLAADYGPKRSNSDRFAGSCLTTFQLDAFGLDQGVPVLTSSQLEQITPFAGVVSVERTPALPPGARGA